MPPKQKPLSLELQLEATQKLCEDSRKLLDNTQYKAWKSKDEKVQDANRKLYFLKRENRVSNTQDNNDSQAFSVTTEYRQRTPQEEQRWQEDIEALDKQVKELQTRSQKEWQALDPKVKNAHIQLPKLERELKSLEARQKALSYRAQKWLRDSISNPLKNTRLAKWFSAKLFRNPENKSEPSSTVSATSLPRIKETDKFRKK